jgi:hypothetical protein
LEEWRFSWYNGSFARFSETLKVEDCRVLLAMGETEALLISSFKLPLCPLLAARVVEVPLLLMTGNEED